MSIKERTIREAIRTRTLDKLNHLVSQLYGIEGMIDLDLDLDSLEEINYVEVLPRWDENKYLSYADFFNLRHVFLREVLRVCGENGLTRTEDRIEDYGGGWFYIVLRCDWLKGELKKEHWSVDNGKREHL